MESRARITSALAALTFGVVASVAYAVMRIIERMRTSSLDPTLVVFDLHTAFYWRALTASWWGGIAAIAFYLMSRGENAERIHAHVARALRVAIVPLVCVLLLSMWVFP